MADNSYEETVRDLTNRLRNVESNNEVPSILWDKLDGKFQDHTILMEKVETIVNSLERGKEISDIYNRQADSLFDLTGPNIVSNIVSDMMQSLRDVIKKDGYIRDTGQITSQLVKGLPANIKSQLNLNDFAKLIWNKYYKRYDVL